MLVEEPKERIVTQNLYDDLEVKLIKSRCNELFEIKLIRLFNFLFQKLKRDLDIQIIHIKAFLTKVFYIYDNENFKTFSDFFKYILI